MTRLLPEKLDIMPGAPQHDVLPRYGRRPPYVTMFDSWLSFSRTRMPVRAQLGQSDLGAELEKGIAVSVMELRGVQESAVFRQNNCGTWPRFILPV